MKAKENITHHIKTIRKFLDRTSGEHALLEAAEESLDWIEKNFFPASPAARLGDGTWVRVDQVQALVVGVSAGRPDESCTLIQLLSGASINVKLPRHEISDALGWHNMGESE